MRYISTYTCILQAFTFSIVCKGQICFSVPSGYLSPCSQVGNYKRAVKRFDDGHRLCNDLMGCLQERAKIEKAYGDQLTTWSKRWRQLIEKGQHVLYTVFQFAQTVFEQFVLCLLVIFVFLSPGPQYGSVERAWLAVMTEAEKVSELHQDVKNNLMNDDVEKVKNWQKEAYHKQMIGGFKEAKEAEEGFKKAQKPWAKKLKEVRGNLYESSSSSVYQNKMCSLHECRM